MFYARLTCGLPLAAARGAGGGSGSRSFLAALSIAARVVDLHGPPAYVRSTVRGDLSASTAMREYSMQFSRTMQPSWPAASHDDSQKSDHFRPFTCQLMGECPCHVVPSLGIFPLQKSAGLVRGQGSRAITQHPETPVFLIGHQGLDADAQHTQGWSLAWLALCCIQGSPSR